MRGIVLDLAKVNWVVILPLTLPVELEECVKQLASFEFWIVLANVGDQNGPRHTTAISEHIRVDASVFGPKLNAPECQLEFFLLGNVLHDGIGHPPPIERLDALRIAVPQECVISQGLDILANLLPLDPCEEQIDVDVLVDHLDAWYKGLSDQHKLLHSFVLLHVLLEDLGQYPKEVIVSVNVTWCHA